MELYTDLYYVKRIQEGDLSCFACLLDKYSRQVHSLILKVVCSREDAEELTQDVFMKVYKNIASFKGDSSFSTWIYRIAYNTAISATRRRRMEYLAIEESTINNVSEEEVARMMGQTDPSEQIEQLEKAIGRLSPDERGMILLYYMQEKTIDDLVEITGLTVSNVKTKLFRIRKKLFVLLKEMEEK
ncbi:RNA polymerase sigma factor [Parabacteroides sp. PF5-6]|uniref:RNA polymerase sigma factor n=1 Tax=Parabacteroides sp. PF5-6 TaxID=1742403 RepID=UPI0024071FA3|nr:RNA polymerase sigma factor [Parabacteroides sp. PF5-6]